MAHQVVRHNWIMPVIIIICGLWLYSHRDDMKRTWEGVLDKGRTTVDTSKTTVENGLMKLPEQHLPKNSKVTTQVFEDSGVETHYPDVNRKK